MQFEIQKADINKDLEIIFDLINLAYEVESNGGKYSFKHTLRLQKHDWIQEHFLNERVYKAVNQNNEIIGCIIYEFMFKQDHFGNEVEPFVYFGPFAVHPSFTGQGIGKKLLKFVEDLAIKANIKRIECLVINWRTDLISMYTKWKFEIYGDTEPFPNPEWLTKPSHFIKMRRSIKF